MKELKILLVFGIIRSFSNIKVESIYDKFFRYGDKDGNGYITDAEVRDNRNQAFKEEWQRLMKNIPTELKAKLKTENAAQNGELARGISQENLRDMSIPGGTNIYLHYL